MEYRLLALDMDGTVLNSEKVISPRTADAIHKALNCGKEVLFATGRCPSEMKEHFEAFPEMKYAMCLSGALILDIQKGVALSDTTIPRPLAEKVLTEAEKLDAMVTVYAGPDVYVERCRKGNMDYFGCQCFASLYNVCAVWVDDIREALAVRGEQVYKINLYCHTRQDWQKAAEVLSGLPLSYASGIPNNYEISPQGVNKGVGLEQLCAVTGIPISQAIAVGDEENDLAMIRAAGLGVAMGNASDAVVEAADVMTADCDHDGVASVIEMCLL